MNQWILERVDDNGGRAINPYMRYGNKAAWERLLGPYWDVFLGEYSYVATVDDFGDLVEVKVGGF